MYAIDQRIFWAILEATHDDAGSPQEQKKLIKGHLSSFKIEALANFISLYKKFVYKLYNSNTWAAAFATLNGCSTKELEAFIGWIISQGEQVYLKAIDNPDSIYTILENHSIQDYNINRGYVPLMNLELIAHDILMHKVSFKHYEIPIEIQQLLAKISSISYPALTREWDENNPETLRAIVPLLVNAYFDVDFWKLD